MQVPVYIAAGGLSRRMGQDKAQLLLAGRPLVLRVADSLAPWACRVTAVVDQPGRLAGLGLRECVDGGTHQGPLLALAAALDDLQPEEDWLLLAPCDVVGLERIDWGLLGRARCPQDQAAAFVQDRWQPLPALYHRSLKSLIAQRLAQGDRSLRGLLDAARARGVAAPEQWQDLHPVNSQAQLLLAEAKLLSIPQENL